MSLKAEEYTCAMCYGVFLKTYSDEDAFKKARIYYTAGELNKELVYLCEDCWKQFMAWKAKQN